MSIDPEDSALEQALRGDLPSADTEARLRRRLLAAGVAIGNGISTTTAAASGAAVSNAAATSVVAKVLGLSWGVKLGLAAAVAIPTLGLWLDEPAPPRPARPSVAARAAAAAPPAAGASSAPLPAVAVAERAPAPAVATAHPPARRDRPAVEAAVSVVQPSALAAPPSRSSFAAAPAATPAPMQAASTLADETRLLDRAFAELAAGNQARAAALIAEHEARYPQGLLKQERERAKIRLSELSRGE